MTRKYYHYKDWEDYKAGQYNVIDFRKVSLVRQEEMIDQAYKLLRDPDRFYKVAKEVVKTWPIASEQHLTDTNSNRRAWLGQAACCYEHGICDQLTKIGWHRINKDDQDMANEVAEKVISEWEKQYELTNQLSLFKITNHA